MDQHATQMGQSWVPGPLHPQLQPQHHPESEPYPEFEPHLRYQPHLQHQAYPQYQAYYQYPAYLQYQLYPQFQLQPQYQLHPQFRPQPQRLGPYPPELYQVGYQPVAPGPADTAYGTANTAFGPGMPPVMPQMMGPPAIPPPPAAISQHQTVAGESLVKQGKRKAEDVDDTQGDSPDNPILIPPPYAHAPRRWSMGVAPSYHPPVPTVPAPAVAANPRVGVPHPQVQVPAEPVGTAEGSSVQRGKRKAEDDDDTRGDTQQPRRSRDDIPGFERVIDQGKVKYKCLHPLCQSLLMKNSVWGHIKRFHTNEQTAADASQVPPASAPATLGTSTFPVQPGPQGLFALQGRRVAQQAPPLPMIGQNLPSAPAALPAIQATRPGPSSTSQRTPPLPGLAQGTLSLAAKRSVQAPPEPRAFAHQPSGIPPMPNTAQNATTSAVGDSDEGLFGSGDEDSDDDTLFGSGDESLFGSQAGATSLAPP